MLTDVSSTLLQRTVKFRHHMSVALCCREVNADRCQWHSTTENLTPLTNVSDICADNWSPLTDKNNKEEFWSAHLPHRALYNNTNTNARTHTLLRIGWGMGTAVKTDVSDICVDNWALLTDVWWHSSRELSMANTCQWHSCQELGAVGRLLTGISDRYSATKEHLLLSDVKDTAVESGRLLESKERKKPPMLLQRDAC